MIYTKQLKEKYNVDVFVAGGGAAGVTAAVAAARQGKKVFLAEATGALGGLGTSGMVPALAPFDDGVNVLASGIGFEIRKNISKHIPLNTYWTSIDAEELKREYDRIMIQAGVDFSFFTTVCDVVVNDGHVDYVVCTQNRECLLSKPRYMLTAQATEIFVPWVAVNLRWEKIMTAR